MRHPNLKFLIACCLGLLLNACGGKDVDRDYAPVPPSSMFIEEERPFCGHEAPDKFSLGYYGSNPVDTTIYLYIICKDDTVFKDQWPGKWFLEEGNQLSDSAQIAEIHRKMHGLIEGQMPITDSLLPEPPVGAVVFSYQLAGHLSQRVYFSKADGKVHKL